VRRANATHTFAGIAVARKTIVSKSATQVRGIAASVKKRVASPVSH
jgi:hypothetical protein